MCVGPDSVSHELKPFGGHRENRPISDAPSGTGNSYVFRHPVLCAGYPCVFAESRFRAAEADRTRWNPRRNSNNSRYQSQSTQTRALLDIRAEQKQTARRLLTSGEPPKQGLPFSSLSCGAGIVRSFVRAPAIASRGRPRDLAYFVAPAVIRALFNRPKGIWAMSNRLHKPWRVVVGLAMLVIVLVVSDSDCDEGTAPKEIAPIEVGRHKIAKAPPIPEPGLLAEPRSLQQVGLPVALTRTRDTTRQPADGGKNCPRKETFLRWPLVC